MRVRARHRYLDVVSHPISLSSSFFLPSSKATDAKHISKETAQAHAKRRLFVSTMGQKIDDNTTPIAMEQLTILDKMSASPNNKTSITIIVSSPKDGVVGK